jgi:predicted RNA-binding Zn-ribbon protein involved in translation (DUF1610 family)
MAERIKLPLLTGFRITGFEPIYSATIELEMNEGPYLVLGGNGLGKTTLMQAVVYGLAGGLDEQTEEIKALRWGHGYFRGRLSATQLATAQVEVDFKLGNHAIAVRRGFKGSNAVAVRSGRGGWETKDADQAFEKLLREHGGYLSASDFAFIVHRLLYLPESRRLIAWDTDAQIRLLMLLNQDIALERTFRESRARLKLLDSKKRHIHVALGKAQHELSRLLEYEEVEPGQEEEEEEAEAPVNEQAEERLPELVARLNDVGRKRLDADRRARGAIADLSRVSAEIDRLRESVEAAEAGLVANFLAESEREQNLALAKLVQGTICPACGQKHAELADRARKFLRDHRCVLCGSEEPHETNPELDKLRDELEAHLREQQAFEEVVRLARAETESLGEQEFELQSRVNEIRYSRSVASMVAMVDQNLPQRTKDTLLQLKQRLADEEADAEAQIRTLRARLEADYQDFRGKVDARMDQLRAAYAGYATAFLGLPCDLEEVDRNGLLELKLFVPRFDDSVRSQPESCSEAQRFFLDIAFRLALIDLACGERGTGTFICETPETALDFSYVSNVVGMFASFAERRHNILLSANIQLSGIAGKLIERMPKRERKKHIVNLLEVGRLSAVQQSARKEFAQAVERMLSAPVKRG